MPTPDRYAQAVQYTALSDPPNLEWLGDQLANGILPHALLTFDNANHRASVLVGERAPATAKLPYLTYLRDTKALEVWIQNGASGDWQEIVRGDQPWANVALASGYSAWTGSTVAPRVRRVGPIVYLEGRMQKTSGSIAAADDLLLGTIPAAYRPIGHYAEGIVATTNAGSGAPIGRIEIRTNGQIAYWSDKATPWIGFSSWWFVT